MFFKKARRECLFKRYLSSLTVLFSEKILKIKQNTNFGMEVDGLKEMKLQPLHYSMIYLENFPSLIIQNLKNGYCSISIVHAMISHSEQQIIL